MGSRVRSVSAKAVPFRRSDIDTDQIVPAEFCKRLSRTGYQDALFFRWRAEPWCPLGKQPYADARVLIAGPRFGVGSSREHAVWALRDFGFQAVIAPSFGDIFRSNATKNFLLTACVSTGFVGELQDLIENEPGTAVTVNLETTEIHAGSLRSEFEIGSYARWQLLNGLNDLELMLSRDAEIESYERRRAHFLPNVLDRDESTW